MRRRWGSCLKATFSVRSSHSPSLVGTVTELLSVRPLLSGQLCVHVDGAHKSPEHEWFLFFSRHFTLGQGSPGLYSWCSRSSEGESSEQTKLLRNHDNGWPRDPSGVGAELCCCGRWVSQSRLLVPQDPRTDGLRCAWERPSWNSTHFLLRCRVCIPCFPWLCRTRKVIELSAGVTEDMYWHLLLLKMCFDKVSQRK